MNTSVCSLPIPVLTDLTIHALSDTGRKRKRDSSEDTETETVNDNRTSIDSNITKKSALPDSTHHDRSFGGQHSFDIDSISDDESNDSTESADDRPPFATISGLTKHGKTFQVQFKAKSDMVDYVRTNWLVDGQCQFCWNCGFKGQSPTEYVDVHLNLLATVAISCRRSHSHVSCLSAKRCNRSGRGSACSSILHQSIVEPVVKRKRCSDQALTSDQDDQNNDLTPQTSPNRDQVGRMDSIESLPVLSLFHPEPTVPALDPTFAETGRKVEASENSYQDVQEESFDSESADDSIGSFNESDIELQTDDDFSAIKNKSSASLFTWIGSFFKFSWLNSFLYCCSMRTSLILLLIFV